MVWPELILPWQRSWPDDPRAPHDWHVPAADLGDSTDVMRIIKIDGGPNNKLWWWTTSRLMPADDDGMRRYRNANGYCETAKAARMAAEEAYGRG